MVNNGAKSAIASVQLQGYSPMFFTLNGSPYIVALHADGTVIGPPSLYPGVTTPAHAVEIIQIYGDGFGPITAPVSAGSPQQFGSLPVMPAFTIGGAPANVFFAGLVSAGLFQFNVQIPPTAPSGDNTITATYAGFTMQLGTLVTVQ